MQMSSGHVQRFPAVALFADVSGFTAISEALGKAGRGGTEELTDILNSYFRPMIDLIQSYGGIIGKFGGDAMTVLFPFSDETQTDTIRRSIRCALEMQENMHQYEAIPTSAGEFSLAMKAGLAMGQALCTTVGDHDIGMEYIIAGELLDLCADAEHHATKGEVVIHNDLLRFSGEIEIVEDRDGFTCVSKLHETIEPAPLSDLEIAPEKVMHTANYLHPVLIERLQGGQQQFLNEHRKVVILFVSFSGFDYDHDPNVVKNLQGYLSQVIQIVDRYDGYVNKVDMGDKGSKYIVMFGAPVAHENDEERALRCAIDLVQIPDIPVRIGINSGFVYSGQVGSPVRQEYTVMGDAVNLSARLMQASQPGEIVVSVAVREAAPSVFDWEDREPIQVKGKTDPISISLFKGIQKTSTLEMQAVAYELPMIGRQEELQSVVNRLEQVHSSKGWMIGVTAEAGMGKSRLATEILSSAQQSGFAVFKGECPSYGTHAAYGVWQNIWRDLLMIDPLAPSSTQLATARRCLKYD